MPNTLQTALLFLIDTVFSLYIGILVVRAILVWVGANYFDPLTQFVIRCTNFISKPLRRVIPNYRNIEISTLLLIFTLEIVKYLLIGFITYGVPNIVGILILSLGDIIRLFLLVFFYAIILQAIFSWVQPYSPVNRALHQFTSPIMQPLHRIVPPVGGFDITPIPALIILQLLIIVVAGPLLNMGAGVAFG